MTAAVYYSGFCGVGRHDACRGAYAGVSCGCPHHTTPPPEPDPDPAPDAEPPGHCPTCTCRPAP